jgi:hypothetical protein
VQSKEFRYKPAKHQLVVQAGDTVAAGDILYSGNITNRIFYIDMARLLLLTVFLLISGLVYYAWRKRIKEGRTQ